MSTPVQPGDLSRLREDGLAAAGEYTALAALAVRPQDGEQAVISLAACCDDGTAFTWWWALVRQNPERFASARQLPSRVGVPDGLVDGVRAHVLGSVSPQEGQRLSPASFSRGEILRRLDPSAPWVVALAHEVITQLDGRTPAVIEAAVGILGASSDAQDREVVFAYADSLYYAKRAAVLARLGDPIGADEARKITESLAEMKGRGGERPDWEPVVRLLSRIPVDVATAYLCQPFPHGTGRRTLLEAGLIPALGAERLRQVLECTDDQAVVAEFLERAAAELSEDDMSTFAEWVHGRYEADLGAGLRQRFARGLQHHHWNGDDGRQRAKNALWACALAGHGPAAVDDELVAATAPGELADRAAGITTEHAARQLGVVAAKMLAASAPGDEAGGGQELVGAVARAGRALLAALGPAFFGSLARIANGTAVMSRVRDPILDAVIESDVSIAAFAGEGGADVLADYAAGTSTNAARVLLAATDHLSADNAGVLLGGERWPVSSSYPGVNWTTTDPDTYLQIVAVMGAWPEVLFGVLARAVAALDEPEALHPSAAVLRALLEAAEEHGLTDDLGDQTTGHVRRLLTEQPDPDVLRAACRWIRRLDLGDAGADLDRAQVVLAADDARRGRQPDLTALRRDLADRHGELAEDLELGGEQRVAHLRMAAQLDAATARATAVRLAQSRTPAVRLAAAETLATTTGSPDEHEMLAALADAEGNAEIAKHLRAALHRLKSGDAGEALRNLAELLDMSRDGLDPAVLIPDERHRDRFAEWTDKARARSSGDHDAGAFIEAAINVADQMVDLALIARQDAGQRLLKPEQIEALRTNAANRLDAGALVRMQNLVNTFTWFPAVATLREKRAAHPSRIGSTTPPRFRPEDLVVAKWLLRDIAEGWMRDMHDSAQRHAASGEPG